VRVYVLLIYAVILIIVGSIKYRLCERTLEEEEEEEEGKNLFVL